MNHNLEKIKDNIIKELKYEINLIDPAFDLDSCLNIYFQVLKFKISISIKNDLGGLHKIVTDSLYEFFIEDQVSETSIGLFCKNFEQFVKKVYYVLEEGEFISSEFVLDHNKLMPLTPYLSVLNKVKSIYKDGSNKDVYDVEFATLVDGKPKFKINPQTNAKEYFRLYPSSLSFDDYNNLDDSRLSEKFQNSFIPYLIKSIILKNEQSHQAPERTKVSNLENFNTSLIAQLWIINFFKKELSESIKKDSLKKKDFENYINYEFEKSSKQFSKFVPLSLKELVNNSVNENISFIDEILKNNNNRIRVLGQGGSGKTTTLEFLLHKQIIQYKNNQLNSKLPVIVFLSNLKSNETIIEHLANKINVSVQYLNELLETNHLILYLDGINEIVETKESKKNKLQEIGNIIDKYPKLSIIVTDRYEFDTYQSNMFSLPTFLIQKLDPQQINDFVAKYCDNSEELTNHVLSVLNTKKNIKDLLLRPLLLTRAIEIIKNDSDLPEMEGQIIERFIDGLLKREKDEKKDPSLNIKYFKLLLSYVANKIWDTHKSNVAIHEFAFNKWLVEASNTFGVENFNAGYVSRIGYELEILSKTDDYIQFFHQSYLEFFCKHYIKYEFE